MQRDRVYLLDILEAARLALEYVGEKTKEAFLEDVLCQDAVIRRIEIIGEAARRVSEETQQAFPELPWNEMIAMRNVMIHDYDGVDMVIVWDTIKKDLPPLIAELEKTV
ncbi:MAG: DUF86 domain-containing protein [Thermodesulfobacteriota bacterium]|nr:DUF86 domain-containing protein [Thermodesulfobacteriota bacterium]